MQLIWRSGREEEKKVESLPVSSLSSQAFNTRVDKHLLGMVVAWGRRMELLKVTSILFV